MSIARICTSLMATPKSVCVLGPPNNPALRSRSASPGEQEQFRRLRNLHHIERIDTRGDTLPRAAVRTEEKVAQGIALQPETLAHRLRLHHRKERLMLGDQPVDAAAPGARS